MRKLTVILTGLFLMVGMASQAQDILVEKGLAYLASVQSPSKEMVEPVGPSIDPLLGGVMDVKTAGNWSGNTGITALALQAFIANGHGVNDPVYGTTVTDAINYILSQQITSGHHTGAFSSTTIGYGTAMAVVALKAALDGAGLVEPMRTQVENAMNLAMNYYTQDVNTAWTQVSWRYDRSYTSQLSGDMSVNQWVYLALDATNYTDKDIWNKVYGYINTRKASSGNQAWIGYTSNPNTWTRGNTCAAIWGLRFAHSFNVAGANALATQMYNFLEQNSLAELFNPASISSHVYSVGGYYYYVYELAKALALGNKTIFAGGEWYNHMYDLIDSQKITDANGNYYWTGWGGASTPMTTALALLSLQTGTVPPESKLTITLEDQGTPSDYTEFTITDDAGYNAKVTPVTVINNIPNSQWVDTSQASMHWEIDLDAAGNYTTMITNNSTEPQTYELCFRAYFEDVLVDEECFTEQKAFIIVQPNQTVAATAFVNAIGGLNIIITNPPAEIPTLEIDVDEIVFETFDYGETYTFQFTLSETGGDQPLQNIDIFASNLVDELGNVIPAANFTFTPNLIAEIPAGGSVTVDGVLVTPASFDKNDIGLFEGIITAQTVLQSKGVLFKLGQPADLIVVSVSNWAILVSILLIVFTLGLYLRFKRFL